MEREERSCSQTVVSVSNRFLTVKGHQEQSAESKEMDHRPSRGPGAKRPGPLAGDDGRNSWGPSWGLGRVLATSLLTSPPPPLAPVCPCSPRAPAWNPGLAAASAPTLSSLSWPQQRQRHVWCQRQFIRRQGFFKASRGDPSISYAPPSPSGKLHSSLPRSPCPTLSLRTNNSNTNTVIITKAHAACPEDTVLSISHVLQMSKLKH